MDFMPPDQVETHFATAVSGLRPARTRPQPGMIRAGSALPAARCSELFDAQLASRHIDLAARWLQSKGAGFYTIGSSGHEGNAGMAAALRLTDPALLHYRSGAFYLVRAGQARPPRDGVNDMLLGLVAAAAEPIAGGRHKVFGHRQLNVIPQTSTIASHLPRAVGLAFALPRAAKLGLTTPWAEDSLVVCSFGDASANHSTAAGAINTAAYCSYQGLPLPLLLVCEDNGLGISVRTPAGWVAAAQSGRADLRYFAADGSDLAAVYDATVSAAAWVRERQEPAFLHIRVVRFGGHAGSDVESSYRSPAEIAADLRRDPLLGTARLLVEGGVLTPAEVLARYQASRERVLALAAEVADAPRLGSAAQVMAPLAPRRPDAVAADATRAATSSVRGRAFGRRRPEDEGLPVPEIQYLAYLHNAADQIRGEAATLSFFSRGQYRNPMVLRIAGLGYQRGFGGHFHNDNAVAALRDIPGLIVAVPARPDDAAAMLRTCLASAQADGSVCVVIEPIALYHERDLHEPGDDGWLAPYDPPWLWAGGQVPPGRARVYGAGDDLTIVSFGNGLRMSLRAAARLAGDGIACRVVDLRWLAPLPADDLLREASVTGRVLIADETRRTGGVSEGIITALLDGGYAGRLARVASEDSFIPLGSAANLVLLSEQSIEDAARALLR